MTQSKKGFRTLVLFAFAFSGAAALVYEVAWTRGLSLLLGSTVYALSTMLATFMGGLAIGAFIGGNISVRKQNPLFYLGLCELGIGLAGVVSIPIIYHLPSLYLYIYWNFHLHATLFYLLQIVICASVMLIPTSLMGATFPLIVKFIVRDIEEVGKTTASAYGFNTIGSVIGSLAVGFFLIPAIGVKGATFVAASINILLGIVLIFASIGTKGIRTVSAALVLFAILSVLHVTARESSALLNFYTVQRFSAQSYQDITGVSHIWDQYPTYYEENVQGSVKAYQMPDGNVVMQVNGKVEGTVASDIPNTLLLAYLPLAAHPSPERFLTIGLGSGVTVSAAKGHVSDLSVVEINGGVVNAMNRLGRPGMLDGIDVIVDDARGYLQMTRKKFDIISSEPSYPTESSVTNLFTVEFYRLASEKLRYGGMFCQWIPYYLLTNDDVTSAIKTFSEVFPYFQLWKTPESFDLILVGSRTPLPFGPEQIRQRVNDLNTEGVQLDYVLSRTNVEFRDDLLKHPNTRINTDDRPFLEFNIIDNIRLADVEK